MGAVWALSRESDYSRFWENKVVDVMQVTDIDLVMQMEVWLNSNMLVFIGVVALH